MLVHGGMAQNVGPILEMVTEKYLLRSEAEWKARQQALGILDEILGALREGDVQKIGAATSRNFHGPIQTIIPWASTYYTETLIATRAEGVRRTISGASGCWAACRAAAWVLSSRRSGKRRRRPRLQAIMSETKRELRKRPALRHGAGGL